MQVTDLNRALHSTLAILAKVEPSQLDAPTPCASWDVRALINHFVGTARWWASTVTGEGDVADADYAAGDFVAAYEESIRIAVTAFETDGVLGQAVPLPFGEFPGAVVLGMAALDQFTHGWDLARAIGQHTDLDPVLAAELLSQARLAITDAFRGPDGQAPFGPARAAPADAEVAPAADQIAEPTEPQARALLEACMAAFENADTAALERLLLRDATLEAPPFRTWFAGRQTCVPMLRNNVLGSPGDWRMLATSANGQPAAAAWVRDQHGTYQPYGIVVLTVSGDGIRRVVSFGDPSLLSAFGFRPEIMVDT